jgi:DNA-binding winged helix-turn-helix (wHTH) protein/tetratricopeptide (TPR) repeat protein
MAEPAPFGAVPPNERGFALSAARRQQRCRNTVNFSLQELPSASPDIFNWYLNVGVEDTKDALKKSLQNSGNRPKKFLPFFYSGSKTMSEKHIYEFGEFQLDAQQKILLRDGERIHLHPKTFATLLALVESNGTVITKDEILAKVWPDTFVEESNLTKNISILRKALSNGHDHSDYIETIPTVGYRFVAQVRQPPNGKVEPSVAPAPAPEIVATSAEPVPDEPPSTVRSRRSRLVAASIVGLGLSLLLFWGFNRQRQPDDAEAVRKLYVSGRVFWNKRTIEGFRQGLTCFEQALTLDPKYAPAWAGVADSWSLLTEYDFASADEGYPKAKAAALRALELDANLAEAHATLATIKAYYEWDWAGAESSFRRALALQPNYATAHQWYAEFLGGQERPPEALAAIARARQLDPDSLIIHATEARIHSMARDYDGVIAKCQELLQRNPNFAEVYSYLGAAYEHKQMFREAMDAYEKRSVMMGDNTPTASALRTSPLRDARDYWENRLRLEDVKLYGSAFDKAQALAQLGKLEEAITWLERSCTRGNASVAFIKINPNYAPLRNHPRFEALLRRVHLSP